MMGRWVQDVLGNDVHDALLNDDVRQQDFGAVDEDLAVVLHVDAERLVGQRGKLHPVLQVGAVRHDVRHQMVAEDAGQVGDGKVGQDVGDGLEGGVVRDEGGEICRQWPGRDVGCFQGTGGGGQVEGHEGGGDVLWEGEEGVDHVNGATSEVVVLFWCMVSHVCKMEMGGGRRSIRRTPRWTGSGHRTRTVFHCLRSRPQRRHQAGGG